MRQWGELISVALLSLLQGESLYQAICAGIKESSVDLDGLDLQNLFDYPDSVVVGRHFSSACYVDQAVPATLYLALKYQHAPESGMIANTMCGGDNAGRGTVLGALFGALYGQPGWPSRWVKGLLNPPPIVLLEQ
jgi:hypothetical protein